jgi:phage terminase large subunit-like protein
VCKPGSGWNVIRISAFDTPNFTDEPVPDALRPLLLDPEWELDKRTRWGTESPRYISKVLGDFPDIGDDVLIPPSLIEAAQKRALEPSGAGILGVDVARFGMDRTVVYLRRGPVIRKVGEWAKQATTETTGRVIATTRETGADEIRVDGVGVGGGVVDQLTEKGFGALDMQAGAAAQDKSRFVNARSEWAWTMRERLESGDADLDATDDDLAAQLGAFKFRYNSKGQIVIESKDEMRKRGLPSPDHADAAILTAIQPAGADLFRRVAWRYWTLDGDHVVTAGRSWALNETWRFLTAYLPSGDDVMNEFTVVSAWARTLDGNLVLLDRARWKLDDATLADKVRPLVSRWRPDTMFVPKKQRTDLVVSELGRTVATTPLDVEPDRMSRAFPASAMQAAGKVWLPTAAWTESAKSEFLAFPHSRHSGLVETLGQAVRVVTTQFIPGPRAAAQPGRSGYDADAGSGIDFMTTDF